MGGVTDLARALPEHIVVPYPNIPKAQYPTSKVDSSQRNTGKEASGSLFPIPLAILVNICGTVVMASVHFFPARRIGAVRVGELREKYPKLKAVEDFRGKNDFAFSLLLRAMQVVNFDIGSMYMGAAGLRTLPFLLGSAAGKMTDIILFPIMGASIGDARFAPFWITVAVDLLIALLTFLWVKQKSRKSKESSIHEKTCR